MKYINIGTFVLFLLLSNRLSAALVEVDYISSNDGLLTLDTESNLEWLDINPTYSISWNEIGTQFAAGEIYAGFRYATSDELETFLLHASVPVHGGSSIINVGEMPDVKAFINMVGGGTIHPTGQVTANGKVFLGTKVYLSALSYYETGETNFSPALVEVTDYNRTDADGGTWIVRNASVVPVPAALWLFGSGLLGLVSVFKRKSHV